jgi:hypothetical protein
MAQRCCPGKDLTAKVRRSCCQAALAGMALKLILGGSRKIVFVFMPVWPERVRRQRGSLAVIGRRRAGQRGLVAAARATAWDGC